MTTKGARRKTRQGTAISEFLETQDNFLSAQEIHVKLRDQGESIGLATVYRTLQRLASDGDVDVVMSDNNEALYRQCGNHHHHHLMCRKCGTAREIVADYIEEWVRRTADEHKFHDIQHSIEVRGVCEDCRADETEASA